MSDARTECVMNVDKNQAVIDYLLQCPDIADSELYFNFINAQDGNKQIVTLENDVYTHKPFIDGSVQKQYTFTILDFKSITDASIVMLAGYENENVADLSDAQALIDWINDQNDLHNFPDFGDDCEVQSIETTTDNPNLEGINTEVSPVLAMYSISIKIEYIDNSKKIWR